MTKKEFLISAYQINHNAESITLQILMPSGEIEEIKNPNVEAKINYISKTYNDDLVHNNCQDIKIEGFILSTPNGIEYVYELKDTGLSMVRKDTKCDNTLCDFGTAILNIKAGHKVARSGWNGKGMFLYYVPEASYSPCTDIAKELFYGADVPYGAYIALKTVSGNVVPWTASQTDILAEDWEVIK